MTVTFQKQNEPTTNKPNPRSKDIINYVPNKNAEHWKTEHDVHSCETLKVCVLLQNFVNRLSNDAKKHSGWGFPSLDNSIINNKSCLSSYLSLTEGFIPPTNVKQTYTY